MINSICQKYYENLQLYNSIENFDYVSMSSNKEMLAILSKNTNKKQKIYQEQNKLIQKLFSILNDEEFQIKEETYQVLNSFAKNLSQSVLELDNEIAFDIYKRLLDFGKRQEDYSIIIESLFWCGICEWKYMVMDPIDFSCTYFEKMNDLAPYFAQAKKEVRRFYIAGIINQILAYTHKDAQPLIDKGKEILSKLEYIEQNYPDTPVNFMAYRSTVYRNILTATDSFQKGIDDSVENRMYVYEIAKESMKLISEKNDTAIPFSSVYYYDFYTAQFHAGGLKLEAFLDKLEELCYPREEYTEKENFCCVFRNSASYIEYVRKYFNEESKEAKQRIQKRVREVLHYTSTIRRNEESATINRYIFTFVEATIDILPFYTVREMLFQLMMNQHRETCIHNLMVEKISRELLSMVIETCPQNLIGACGYQTKEEIMEHRLELANVMKDMALIHDLGKYKCLSIISNGSRKIDDREFIIIKRHPEYGYEMIQSASVNGAIKDGILLHHRWHNGKGGYPQGYPQSKNQPLIDILSMADSLDAATDPYGRSYAFHKTLEELMEEFKCQPERYADFLTSLLEKEEVKCKVDHLLREERDSLYAYLCRKQYDEILNVYPDKIRLGKIYC